MPQRSEALAQRAHRRAGLLLVVGCSAAALFAVLTVLVLLSWRPLLDADLSTSSSLHRIALSHKTFTALMRAVSDAGSTIAWVIIFIPVLAWLAVRKLPRLAAFVLITAIGSSLLNNLMKLAVHRARPRLADPVAVAAGKSFPSGHSQAAIVGYAILLIVFLPVVRALWRPWLSGLAVLAVLVIGFSRIALGVHYLSDVTGAYLLGAAWLIGMLRASRGWRRRPDSAAEHLVRPPVAG